MEWRLWFGVVLGLIISILYTRFTQQTFYLANHQYLFKGVMNTKIGDVEYSLPIYLETKESK